jgi:flagellar protein FlgJ
MLKGIASEPALTELHKDISPDKLKKACTEFESLFITYMLKSMRTSIAGEGQFLNNNAGKMIQSMFDENLSLEIAKGGGMGLTDMLFERLKS